MTSRCIIAMTRFQSLYSNIYGLTLETTLAACTALAVALLFSSLCTGCHLLKNGKETKVEANQIFAIA